MADGVRTQAGRRRLGFVRAAVPWISMSASKTATLPRRICCGWRNRCFARVTRYGQEGVPKKKTSPAARKTAHRRRHICSLIGTSAIGFSVAAAAWRIFPRRRGTLGVEESAVPTVRDWRCGTVKCRAHHGADATARRRLALVAPVMCIIFSTRKNRRWRRRRL